MVCELTLKKSDSMVMVKIPRFGNCGFLVLLMLVIFGIPIASEVSNVDLLPVGLSLVVLGGFKTTELKFRWMLMTFQLFILGAIWTCFIFPEANLQGFQFLMASGLLFFATYSVGGYLSRLKEVNIETLAASIAGYLLFGFACGALYAALYVWWPHGIHFDNLNRHPNLFDFTYYSFIVISTIGLGDTVPVNAIFRSMTILEGVIGLFYVAIFISRLVSLYQRQKTLELEDVSDV